MLVQMDPGHAHSCGANIAGALVSWGDHANYESGFSRTSIPPEGTFRQMAAGFVHSCGGTGSGDLLGGVENEFEQHR